MKRMFALVFATIALFAQTPVCAQATYGSREAYRSIIRSQNGGMLPSEQAARAAKLSETEEGRETLAKEQRESESQQRLAAEHAEAARIKAMTPRQRIAEKHRKNRAAAKQAAREAAYAKPTIKALAKTDDASKAKAQEVPKPAAPK